MSRSDGKSRVTIPQQTKLRGKRVHKPSEQNKIVLLIFSGTMFTKGHLRIHVVLYHCACIKYDMGSLLIIRES